MCGIIMTDNSKSHLDMAEDFTKALRMWIKYRLDSPTPSKTVELEITQATKLMIQRFLNPTCEAHD